MGVEVSEVDLDNNYIKQAVLASMERQASSIRSITNEKTITPVE